MSRRRKILIYALLVGGVVALAGLVALLAISGLDDAANWAGVLALFVGLATLGLALYETVRGRSPAPPPPTLPVPTPTPAPSRPPLPAPASSPEPPVERQPAIDAPPPTPPPTPSSTSPVARPESMLKGYARLQARHLDGFRKAMRW